MRRVIEPSRLWVPDRLDRRPRAADGSRGAPAAIADLPVVPSAQVKSAMLLAGLHAEGTTTSASRRRRAITPNRRLRLWRNGPRGAGLTVSVQAASVSHGQQLTVPGDFSSAAFWMVAAAARPGSRVELEDVD